MRIAFYIFVAIAFLSCTEKVNSKEELRAWIGNEENGHYVKKNVGDFSLSMQYMHPVSQAQRNQEDIKWEYLPDSLKKAYNSIATFVFNIKPAEGKSFNIMHWGVRNEAGFKTKNMQANFHMQEYLQFKSSCKECMPVYTILENTYNVEMGKKWNITFPVNIAELNCDTISIVFTDELFNTGLTRFNFSKYKLQKYPKLNY